MVGAFALAFFTEKNPLRKCAGGLKVMQGRSTLKTCLAFEFVEEPWLTSQPGFLPMENRNG